VLAKESQLVRHDQRRAIGQWHEAEPQNGSVRILLAMLPYVAPASRRY